MQFLALKLLIPNLTTIMTGSCQAAQLYRHWSLTLNLLRFKIGTNFLFCFFFCFRAKLVTQQNVTPTNLASFTAYLSIWGDESLWKDIVRFIVYSTELMINNAKAWRVHEVGHLEQLHGGEGSSALVETLVELSVI